VKTKVGIKNKKIAPVQCTGAALHPALLAKRDAFPVPVGKVEQFCRANNENLHKKFLTVLRPLAE
jgi:hypothetical protein